MAQPEKPSDIDIIHSALSKNSDYVPVELMDHAVYDETTVPFDIDVASDLSKRILGIPMDASHPSELNLSPLVGRHLLGMELRNAGIQAENQRLEYKRKLLQENVEHLATLANLDPLTGLSNRRVLETVYEGIARSAQAGKNSRRSPKDEAHAVSLDIDFFKAINDSRGHIGGDEILTEIAKILQGKKRKRDVAVRWGGDELLVLLPRTDQEGAAIFTTKIMDAVQKSSLDFTVSVGVAKIDPSSSLGETIKRVDAALYMAKEQGRNRVVNIDQLEENP